MYASATPSVLHSPVLIQECFQLAHNETSEDIESKHLGTCTRNLAEEFMSVECNNKQLGLVFVWFYNLVYHLRYF